MYTPIEWVPLEIFYKPVVCLYSMRIELKDETVERLERVRGKPIRTRGDRAINEVLDLLERKNRCEPEEPEGPQSDVVDQDLTENPDQEE